MSDGRWRFYWVSPPNSWAVVWGAYRLVLFILLALHLGWSVWLLLLFILFIEVDWEKA